nr:hypothetical protein [Tanacetum cinerariifolium]
MPPKPDLVFTDEHVVSESITSLPGIANNKVNTSKTTLKNVSAPIIEDWVSDTEDEDEIETESNQIKPSFAKVKFVKPTEHVKSPRKSIKKEENNRQNKYPRKNSQSPRDTEVSTCSKACLKSYETLKEHYDNLIKDFNKSQFNLGAYKASLASVEARLEVYKKNETVFEDDIKILKLNVMLRDKAITELRQKFKKVKKERDNLKLNLEKFQDSSKNLSRLLDSQ